VIDGRIDGLTAASISGQHYTYAVDYLGDVLKQAAEQWAADHPALPPLDSVDVITHSTGGLVARTYVQSGAYGGGYASGKHLPRVNNLIMVGVPNQGASKAWNPLHDNWVVDPAFQMVLSKIIDRAYQKVLNQGVVISGPDYNINLASISLPQCLDLPEVCFINQYVPTARALLATYDFIDFGSGLTNVNGIPDLRNTLLLDLNAGDPNAFADLVTAKPTIIYGTNGADTPTTVVEKVGPTTTALGFHPIADFAHIVGRDANAGETYYRDNTVANGGDGTVPLISSEGQFRGDARVALMHFTKGGNTSSDVDHTALPYNPDVQLAILNTLGVSCPAPGCTISTGKNSVGANAATACAAGCSNFGLDPVDGFMVDGQGRRLGFSAGTGPLAEIPGSVWFGNSDGTGWVFGPVEEPVKLELTGLGQHYYVTASVMKPARIGDVIDSGVLGPGAPKTLPLPLVATTTVADRVPAVAAAALSPQPNTAGWNNSDVVVTLSATDDGGGSGVKEMIYSATGAQPIAGTTVTGASVPIGITTEGRTMLTFFARDNAGNEGQPQTILISLDKTPPVITATRAPAPNVNGWNNTPVTVAFECSDFVSGMAVASAPAPVTVSSDGRDQSAVGSCRDVAGNSSAAILKSINIDTIAPLLTPPANRVVQQADAAGALVTYSAPMTIEGGSGLLSTSCAPVSGSMFPPGSTTVNCASSDLAGNNAFTTFTVTVNPTMKCDANRDGAIDQADLLAIRIANGQAASGTDDPRDGNSDGRINVADMRYCQLRITSKGQ
jgi:hypothetical protein